MSMQTGSVTVDLEYAIVNGRLELSDFDSGTVVAEGPLIVSADGYLYPPRVRFMDSQLRQVVRRTLELSINEDQKGNK